MNCAFLELSPNLSELPISREARTIWNEKMINSLLEYMIILHNSSDLMVKVWKQMSDIIHFGYSHVAPTFII